MTGAASVVAIPAEDWPPADPQPNTLYLKIQSWTERAACRGSDPSLFVPDKASPIVPEIVKTACPPCPVRQQCLDYGMEVGASGWWGGRRLLDGQPGALSNEDGTRRQITAEDTAQIKDRWRQGGTTQRELAAQFGVSRQYIAKLVAKAKATT